VPSVSALVLLYDIRGFTAATKRMDAARIGAFATAAHGAILAQFRSPPPTFVKNLGDGHLLLWETGLDPDPALLSAVVAGAAGARAAFTAFVAGQEAAGEGLPKHVGIGIAFGVVSKSDDYYGVALNLAARLQNLARPEGLALDGTVFEAVARKDAKVAAEFERSKVRLKGLGSTTVYVKRPFSWARLVARVGWGAAAAAVVLGYVALADAGVGIPGGEAMRAFLDGQDVSVFRAPRPIEQVVASAEAQRRELATVLFSARTPAGWFTSDVARSTEKDGVDVWSSSQTACALLGAPHLGIDELRPVLEGLAHVMKPPVFVRSAEGTPYGWRSHPATPHTEAEPLLWTVAALARALGRPGLVPPERREEFLGHLRLAQEAGRRHRPLEDGGWNMFPDQKDPAGHSPYTTALALLALLELRAAQLPWEGDVARRDAMLVATCGWFARTFAASDPVPGWRRTQDPLDVVSKGLSLQVHSLLLRADALAEIPVPAAIRDAASALVVAQDRVGLESSSPDAGEFAVPFTPHDAAIDPATGRPALMSGKESINFLWHPWAVATAQALLERTKREAIPRLEAVRLRRVRGWLVVDQAAAARKAASVGYTFMASETLYGLSTVPPP
jgi:class 3 adenylate cyclase